MIDFKPIKIQDKELYEKLLFEEMQHKGTHPDLIVRVCGYSAVFGQLSREMQNEIYNRV